jgi:translation initiation factor IF-3
VEISPKLTPPVCKILDYGKFKFEQQKKANAARKKQKVVEIKEIKMRPNIDIHDYNVKMKKVFEFIEGGDKVKLTIRFRGREMAHLELGSKILDRVTEDVKEVAKVESRAKMEGRQLMMVIAGK